MEVGTGGGAGVLLWRWVWWLKLELAGDKEELRDEPHAEHQLETAWSHRRL
jgi:hypothetical protein